MLWILIGAVLVVGGLWIWYASAKINWLHDNVEKIISLSFDYVKINLSLLYKRIISEKHWKERWEEILEEELYLVALEHMDTYENGEITIKELSDIVTEKVKSRVGKEMDYKTDLIIENYPELYSGSYVMNKILNSHGTELYDQFLKIHNVTDFIDMSWYQKVKNFVDEYSYILQEEKNGK
jgi:hypothetical protein